MTIGEIEKTGARELENARSIRAPVSSSRVLELAILATLALLLVAAGTGQAVAARQIAITFDDLPGVSQPPTVANLEAINTRLLATLRIDQVPTVGFVNEHGVDVDGQREARAAILRRWLDAHMELGNHTYSHPDLNNTPADEYQLDILKGERITRTLVTERGLTLHWFRHPFTHTGPTTDIKARIDGFLGAHGYDVAPFTIETADYMFAAVYERAVLARDEATADKVMAAYLGSTDERVAFCESLAADTFGHDIAQVLLIHVNRLNADAMPELLRRLKSRGYAWIPLGEAVKDSVYRTRDDYVGPVGPSWLHRWRIALGKADRTGDEPDPPTWVLEAFNKGRQ